MAAPGNKLTVLVPTSIQVCPPSVADSTLSYEEELGQRLVGCEWIQKAAILLSVGTEAMCNGQVIFHRFFYRRSMREFDVKLVATGALYLGCKLAETSRRVQDFVHVFSFMEWLSWKEKEVKRLSYAGNISDMTQLLESLEVTFAPFFHDQQQKPEFLYRKTNIHRIERHILRETGFKICEVLVYPHRFTIQYIHCLFGNLEQKDWRNAVVQTAWGYLNDALPLCCVFQSSVLTIASIYLSIEENGVSLPHVTYTGVWIVVTLFSLPQNLDWVELFDVSVEDMMAVVDAIKQMYATETPAYRVLANPPVPPPSHLMEAMAEGIQTDHVRMPNERCIESACSSTSEMRDQPQEELLNNEEENTASRSPR